MQFKTFFSALVLAAPALAETVRPNVYFNNDQRQLSAGGCSNLESRYATLGGPLPTSESRLSSVSQV